MVLLCIISSGYLEISIIWKDIYYLQKCKVFIDWSIDWFIDWLIDLLIDWFIDLLIFWLIYWFIYSGYPSPQFKKKISCSELLLLRYKWSALYFRYNVSNLLMFDWPQCKPFIGDVRKSTILFCLYNAILWWVLQTMLAILFVLF